MPNVITYPGVTGVISVEVTTSVGIEPAVISLVCDADSDPAVTGTLVLGDGLTNQTLTFPDCLARTPRQSLTRTSREVTVELQDRRWRWRYGFPADGHFNQEAGSGKLVPWSVRSPWQLAYALLTAMGELADPADQIDLPGGLADPDAPGGLGPHDRAISAAGQYLGLGQNYALTQSNPETRWTARPAAQALADLAEYYGRLVVLDPLDDRVRLRRVGVGDPIPAGFRLRQGRAVHRDAIPARVIARGSPTDHQIRLRVRPVGREWDGSWRPIHELSYAPPVVGQPMICWVVGRGAFDPAATYTITLNDVAFTPAGPVASWADLASALAALVNASADPAVAGKVSAAAVGGRLVLTGVEDGYEFALSNWGTDGARPWPDPTDPDATADTPPDPGSAAANWTPTCVQGPIRGQHPRQNAWRVTFPDPQPVGTVLSVTVNGVATARPVAAVVPAHDLNALAAAVDDLAAAVAANATALGATAAGGGRTLVVTGATAGVVVSVSAASSTGAAPEVEEVATAVAEGKGWERCPGPPFGVFARATDRLSQPEARRLANETVFTCYQVVCEDPADPTNKWIPVPTPDDNDAPVVLQVTNPYRIVLQPDSPEPVTPEPGAANVTDARTLQPFAATTYNGYAVRRPNRVFGSVAKHVLARDGLLWRGGTDLGHNTTPRAPLPLSFSIADPEKMVIRFSQPVYRWLGSGAASLGGAILTTLFPRGFTTRPAELVVECGATVLDAATLTPLAFERSAAVPGGFGPDLTRVFPDVRREVIGHYDARHRLDPETPYRVLDQDAAARAGVYAAGVADTFQAPPGESVEYDGLEPVALSGAVRQIRWRIAPGEPGVSTSVDVNCETSRVVLPYPARRKAEGLTADAARAQQNLLSDFLARAAVAARNNALGAAAGGLAGGQR